MAQSVPSATLIPCVGSMPVGWSFTGSSVQNNVATLWLSSTVAGSNAVEAQLTPTCDPGTAPEVVPAPDEAGARVFEAPDSLDPFRATRYVVFDGGCVTYRYTFAAERAGDAVAAGRRRLLVRRPVRRRARGARQLRPDALRRRRSPCPGGT